ncbi:hypothetical protein [Streptomyces avidinii]
MAFALVAVIGWIGLRNGHGIRAAASGTSASAEPAPVPEQAVTAGAAEKADATG